MTKILLINGSNFDWDQSAPILDEILNNQTGVVCTLTSEKSILASSELADFDAVIIGSGFMRYVGQPAQLGRLEPEFSDAETEGLLSFVRGGRGFVGIHTTGWAIGGQHVLLVGGNCNMHPPISEEPFVVHIEDKKHPITQDLDDFSIQGDEIYVSARDPYVRVLATATWAGFRHAMAWTHTYGDGRVFYTALGHGPKTFQNPTMQRMLINAADWVSRR